MTPWQKRRPFQRQVLILAQSMPRSHVPSKTGNDFFCLLFFDSRCNRNRKTDAPPPGERALVRHMQALTGLVHPFAWSPGVQNGQQKNFSRPRSPAFFFLAPEGGLEYFPPLPSHRAGAVRRRGCGHPMSGQAGPLTDKRVQSNERRLSGQTSPPHAGNSLRN